MGRIQRAAEGFLSLVGNKVGGREPTSLSDVVIPSVDMTQLLLGRELASEGGISLGVSSIGTQITITVPDNQVWLLKQVSSEVIRTASGNRVKVKSFLTKLPQSSSPLNEIIIMARADTPGVGMANTAQIEQARTFDTPFVLPAGVEIVFEVTDSNTGLLNWSGQVGFYRLTA